MTSTILIVTSDAAKWQPCLPVFGEHGADVTFVSSLDACKEALRGNPTRLYVLDLGLEGKELRAALMDLLMINAAAHSAVTTGMEADAFHDAMEGLGILTGLPLSPGENDIRHMLDLLAKL